MKRLAMEELCGLILLLMVFLAAKYGSVQVVSAQAQKKEQPVVVVDVGHGGRDPGKVGIDGSLEKDVNLAIALARANGNYYLLLHVKCPIVIVECGFLSNRKEAALLQDPEYQDRMAWTVHMGIMEYLGGSA